MTDQAKLAGPGVCAGAIHHGGGVLVPEAPVTIEIQTVSMSFAGVNIVNSLLKYCVPKLRSLVPSSVSDVGKTKAPFWVRSGGYLPLSASRLTLQSSPVPGDRGI